MTNNTADMRNFVRNLVMKAANKQFSGNQRITTGRDSMAFTETTSSQRPSQWTGGSSSGIVGSAQAGE